MKQRKVSKLESFSGRCTAWIGSPASLVVHTVLFAAAFLITLFGVPWSEVLLVLTTVVSLEAIYLAIFIQISVNQNTRSLHEVEEDIDEIQEDIGEIQEEVDEMVDEDSHTEEEQVETLHSIEQTLKKLSEDFETLKRGSKMDS